MNVLIIDDEYQMRKDYYEKIFEGFEITGIDRKEQLAEVKYKNYKLIAVDLFLWNQTPSDAKMIINAIDVEIPIVLISQKWNDRNGSPLEEIATLQNSKQIIKIIAFQRLMCAVENDIKKICDEYNSEIIINYNKFYNYNSAPIKHDATINILHISDMQFGGKISQSADFDVDTIYEFLQKNFCLPHIVMISGDIAQSGHFGEYQDALKWFDNLKKQLFKEDNAKNRFVITPGNHDADFNLFGGFSLKYDFKNSAFEPFGNFVDVGNDRYLKYKKSDVPKHIIDEVVYNNFSRFAYELTEDERWLLNSNHYNLVISNYENIGIRIISVNSNSNISPVDEETKDALFSHRGAGIDVESCQRLKDSLNEDKLFTIVLSHLGPNDLGKDSENTVIWDQVRNFLDSIKCDLWLCGHTHQLKAKTIDDDDARYISEKPYAYSGSLRLNPSSLPEDAHRGFNVIQLSRVNGEVSKINVKQCEIIKNNIRIKNDKQFLCNLND